MKNPYRLPWTVEESPDDEELKTVYGISDCDGNTVVCTDCGYYPLKLAVAQFIVATVNATRKEL